MIFVQISPWLAAGRGASLTGGWPRLWLATRSTVGQAGVHGTARQVGNLNWQAETQAEVQGQHNVVTVMAGSWLCQGFAFFRTEMLVHNVAKPLEGAEFFASPPFGNGDNLTVMSEWLTAEEARAALAAPGKKLKKNFLHKFHVEMGVDAKEVIGDSSWNAYIKFLVTGQVWEELEAVFRRLKENVAAGDAKQQLIASTEARLEGLLPSLVSLPCCCAHPELSLTRATHCAAPWSAPFSQIEPRPLVAGGQCNIPGFKFSVLKVATDPEPPIVGHDQTAGVSSDHAGGHVLLAVRLGATYSRKTKKSCFTVSVVEATAVKKGAKVCALPCFVNSSPLLARRRDGLSSPVAATSPSQGRCVCDPACPHA